jgi:2-hydroxychromene-2-carboxylate isomerase
MALKENSGEEQFRVIDTIYMNGWGKGQDIGDEKFLVKILLQEGIDGNKLLENVGSKEIRNALKFNLKKALGLNVFGVPTFMIGDELFWGNDSIEHLKLYLGEMDPLDKQKYEIFLEKIAGIFGNSLPR